jgi:hypothetical protein
MSNPPGPSCSSTSLIISTACRGAQGGKGMSMRPHIEHEAGRVPSCTCPGSAEHCLLVDGACSMLFDGFIYFFCRSLLPLLSLSCTARVCPCCSAAVANPLNERTCTCFRSGQQPYTAAWVPGLRIAFSCRQSDHRFRPCLGKTAALMALRGVRRLLELSSRSLHAVQLQVGRPGSDSPRLALISTKN